MEFLLEKYLGSYCLYIRKSTFQQLFLRIEEYHFSGTIRFFDPSVFL